MLIIFGDPQNQRARGSALFPLTKMHQAAHYSQRIQRKNIFGTNTPFKKS